MEKAILKSITEITAAVKGLAPEVWGILLKQTYLMAMGNIIGIIIGFVLTITGLIMVIKTKEYSDWKIPGMFGLVLGLVVIGICSFCAFFYLHNPEFYAIQFLIPGK